MGTYLPVPPDQPAVRWLIENAGATLLTACGPHAVDNFNQAWCGGTPVPAGHLNRPTSPPARLADIPAGLTLVAVARSGAGFDASLVVASDQDLEVAAAATKPVTWLLIDFPRISQLLADAG
jgi:hypothetical protein